MSCFYAVYPSPLGPITILSDGEAITGIHFDYRLSDEIPLDNIPPLSTVCQWLDRYFAGQAPDPKSLPLTPKGTHFQQTVWALLRQIPYGQTVTYGELAKRTAAILGKPRMSAQAIGGAVGKNPIVVAIPCHRVLGSDGKLTGFSAGIERKIALLELEHIKYKQAELP